jgi:hypothetical protein
LLVSGVGHTAAMLSASNAISAHTNAIGSLGMTTDPINPNTPSTNKMILIIYKGRLKLYKKDSEFFLNLCFTLTFLLFH